MSKMGKLLEFEIEQRIVALDDRIKEMDNRRDKYLRMQVLREKNKEYANYIEQNDKEIEKFESELGI
jgi:SMC interacting uncharacterized protein involved in chromosome segregation